MKKIIQFNIINNSLKLRLKNKLNLLLKYYKINKNSHILIIGMGNDNYTADSVGPEVLKHIKANAYLKKLGAQINKPTISLFEPGTLGKTGIITEKIIKNIVSDTNPDILIIIDSFLTNDINKMNKTIEINNKGLSTGIGIRGINSNIDEKSMGKPIIVIGVTTAIEIKYNNINYILSNKNIDLFVEEISDLIGNTINEIINEIE